LWTSLQTRPISGRVYRSITPLSCPNAGSALRV
jgi:hypothetical protein